MGVCNAETRPQIPSLALVVHFHQHMDRHLAGWVQLASESNLPTFVTFHRSDCSISRSAAALVAASNT